jgi:alanyl-tRNA synthetase
MLERLNGLTKTFKETDYALPFFKQEGFVRKHCPKCGEFFWTQNAEQKTCGESGSDECGCYTFLGNPATNKKFSLSEMREAFLSFFEKNGHTRIKPYPVVARWRKDIYLTHASIIDFQPYVTEGISPPPANPLVISQPCIRLTDISNTGPTFGRHLTIFEMGGAHAFNYPDKEVYWKDDTVRFHHQFATECLGIKSEEVIYKEGVWVGGGNAGPDVECICRGLEVGTLVFMQYKVVGDDFVELPIRTVDTGYGIDRFTWISQGVPSLFQAIYGDLLDKVMSIAGITNVDNDFLARVAKYSGLVSVDKRANRLVARKRVSELTGIDMQTLDKVLIPIENAWAVTDHTKTLSFMLSEGVVPSNIQEGYLARLLFRRVYRLMRSLNMQPAKLYDIVDMQTDYWGTDFPRIKEMQKEIIEMLKVEEEKFVETLKRGEGMVKRIATDLKTKGTGKLPMDTLTELYDSHGLPPEIVKQAAEKQGVEVEVPENFYALIANRHMQAPKPVEEEQAMAEEKLEKVAEELPPTEQLYYDDVYMKESDAKVLKIISKTQVVLNKTCFYPEGGGQPTDQGWLLVEDSKFEVVDVQKIGKVIVHKLKEPATFKEDSMVHCILDWDRRYSLMKAHTVTHLINGAARRVLGEHVWQSGTQKGLETSRLDISHYRRLTQEEIHQIETLANQAISANMKVETTWLPRNEAESRYGFRLYQGGAVPGKDIRVVKTGDWDVEACAGTHLGNTSEVGFVKIVYTERIQDGVERLGYAVGLKALKAVQDQEKTLLKVSEVLTAPVDKLDKTAEKVIKELKETTATNRRLEKKLAAIESNVQGSAFSSIISLPHKTVTEIEGFKMYTIDYLNDNDISRMIRTTTEITKNQPGTIALSYSVTPTSGTIIMSGSMDTTKAGFDAGKVIREVGHIFGGSGGGRPDFAQGGGKQPEKIVDAVKAAQEVVKKQVKH